jgi:hypothetical protein
LEGKYTFISSSGIGILVPLTLFLFNALASGYSHLPLGANKSASKLLLSFGKNPARCPTQQFDKSKETQLSIGVPNPIM